MQSRVGLTALVGNSQCKWMERQFIEEWAPRKNTGSRPIRLPVPCDPQPLERICRGGSRSSIRRTDGNPSSSNILHIFARPRASFDSRRDADRSRRTPDSGYPDRGPSTCLCLGRRFLVADPFPVGGPRRPKNWGENGTNKTFARQRPSLCWIWKLAG